MPTTTRPRSRDGGLYLKSTDRGRGTAGAILGLWLTWVCGAVVLVQTSLAAQPGPGGNTQPPPPALTVAVSAEASGQPSTLVFFNRPIVTLNATVLGRQPHERAEG